MKIDVKKVAKLDRKEFRLNLRGKTAVFVDWANVFGWRKSLKKEVDINKLFKYLKNYKEINEINFYYGEDKHPKSKQFLRQVKSLGYQVTTKPVKYISVAVIDDKKIFRRKCDFDMEICIDVHKLLQKEFTSFIIFSGDGDFEPLYKLLIGLKKQIVVIYAGGHLGREIWELKRGIFKTEIDNFPVF